jgi:tetratricopeptide (TPR) repeat protein
VRAVRTAYVVLALSLISACAAKTAPPPAAPGEPKFPDFIFPAPPAGAPGDVVFQHETAWRFLQAGDVKAAERGFALLTKSVPDFYAAETGLGYAALARKDAKNALGHFERAVSADPKYAPALAGKGRAHLALDQAALALESFDRALAADPSLPSVRNTADVLRLQVMQGGVAEARKAASEGRLTDARVAYEQAILTSPQSPFLFRELSAVELRESRLPAALAHAQKAVELEPTDARNHVTLADVLEAQGEFAKAIDSLTAAAAAEPSDALSSRIAALREKGATDALPAEYRDIGTAESITRAQLAALIGIQLGGVVKRAPAVNPALLTDVRGNWAAEWIIPVTRAGFMEAFPNHTFQPEGTVRRSDLARVVSRMLNVIASGNPELGNRLRAARRTFTDLSPGHLQYPYASVAVEAGAIATLDDGSFQLARPVSGGEALAAIRKLQELAGPTR